ncbi:MAG: RNA polymerase sigma factor [Pseudomonadota bacterium]
MSDETRTDEELMLAYQRGDEDSFRVLYGRYAGRVYGYLRLKLSSRSVVDDAFQTVFLKLHQFRGRYRPVLPFAPWLFTISRNVVWDILRSQARSMEDASPMDIEQASVMQPTPATDLPELATLTPERRQALELRFGQDLSFHEIAKRLETSPANVRQLVSRSLRQLKRTMGGRGTKS